MKKQMYKYVFIAFVCACAILLCCFSACSTKSDTSYNDKGQIVGMSHPEGYTLEQMTVLNRHHIRSALSEHGSDLANLCAYEWLPWTSQPGDLTLTGEQEEMFMGQYFRKYLEAENFIPINWFPKDDEVYFYANSQQRTIASTQTFSNGFLPVANVNVNYKYSFNDDDPVFWRNITKKSDAFKQQVLNEVSNNQGVEGLKQLQKDHAANFKSLEKVLNFKNSQYAKDHNISSFDLDDISVSFEYNKAPQMTGSLKLGNSASDALKLQYYEHENDKEAAFSNNLTFQDWENIGELGDLYQKTMFGSHTAAIDKANPMLKELKFAIENKNRKFTFFGGHDDNIMSLLTALDVCDYKLENALNKRSPVGACLVFSKWKNNAGEEFFKVSVVYETVDQLRHRYELSLDCPPAEYQLSFQSMGKNADGMYKLSDIEKRIDSAIAQYDEWE